MDQPIPPPPMTPLPDEGGAMIGSLLIANRGEIACRVIRTARDLGIRTVAIYSDADAKALHVREADEAVHIGPSPAAESYLRGERIIAAAKHTGAEAIHPGYGFLSENAEFAEAVAGAGLIWVGPKPASIRAMGLKDAAKKLMQDAGVPVTPGYMGDDQNPARLLAEAEGSAGRYSSRPSPAAAARACARSTRRSQFVTCSNPAGARRRPASATTRSCSKSGSPARATSRCRCSATPTATSSTCSSATARSSAATRR
jgi:hypothetical protein